jgi:lipoic acid synthetase
VSGAGPEAVGSDEPENIRRACLELALDHVIITSVTRDDLPDGGSEHFGRCVRALKGADSGPVVEVLTPDFGGNLSAVDNVVAERPDVFAHNLETVERLYPEVRDRADYRVSLGILRHVRVSSPDTILKSGLMVGLGETIEEVKSAIRDLSMVGCDIVTVGQYLQPSSSHVPVAEYVSPCFYESIGEFARDLGLIAVCAPKVRSSYMAKAAYEEAFLRRYRCA